MTHARSVSRLMASAALAGLLIGGALPTQAASGFNGFTPGDVVVYRVGDGSTTLSSTAAPVFLDEYSPAGSLVQSIPLPITASGANKPLVASGTATSEGLLTESANGQFLLATGYDDPVGTAAIAGTSVPRTVARIDGNGAVDTTTALTDFAVGNNPRSAASPDGTQLFLGGAAGGVRAAVLGGSTSTQLNTTLTNVRQVQVFGGQLYTSTASGSTVRIGTVGTGLPTAAGQAIANLPGFETATGSPYSFALLDLAAANSLDTLYVAEDTTGGGQIQKYSLDGGSWTAEGAVAAPAVRGLTASVSGTTVTIFATTGGSSGATPSGGSLYKLVDGSGPAATIGGTLSTLVTVGAAANESFRGIAFAPSAPAPQVPETPLAVALPLGALAVLLGWFAWRRRRAAA